MKEIKDAELRVAKLREEVLVNFCDWLENQSRNAKRSAETHRNRGKLAESRTLCERSDVFRECLVKVQQMRRTIGELEERNRLNSLKRLEKSPQEPLYNPTPEEIAAGCLEVQRGWSEAERARRHWQSAQSVEMNPTNFVF